uniref:Uncharacterized protein n=1 Tax=Micrurus spixii TaxID=129469 RepID=A0A2D4LLW3_9SAUR
MRVQKIFQALGPYFGCCISYDEIRDKKKSKFNVNKNVYQWFCIQHLQPLLHWTVYCTGRENWMNNQKTIRPQCRGLHAGSQGTEFLKAAPVMEDYDWGGEEKVP